jgi:hypothetical protein
MEATSEDLKAVKRILQERNVVPKRLFVWNCGQISAGLSWMWKEKNNMIGDGVSEWSEEVTGFWAVATPL